MDTEDQRKAIAELVRRGYGNKQIARELGISMGHVKNRLTSIYKIHGISGGCRRAKLAAMLASKNKK